jgi:PAS domain S-box-containing protein
MAGGQQYQGRSGHQGQEPVDTSYSSNADEGGKQAVPLEGEAIRGLSRLQAENRRLRQAFDLLRESQEEMSQLLTATELPAICVDTDLRLRRFTPAAAVLMRLCEADLGRPLGRILGRFRCLGLHEDARRILESGLPIESQLQTDQGRWVVKRGRPMRDERGRTVGVVFTFLDQTRRMQNENDLKKELRFREALIQTVPSPVFWKDTQGRYLGCNIGFARDVLGLSRQEIHGKSISQLAQAIPEDLAQVYREKDRQLLAHGGVQIYASEVEFAHGGRRKVEFRKAVFHDEAGSPAGIVGVILDRQRQPLEPQADAPATSMPDRPEAADETPAPAGQIRDEKDVFRAIAEFSYDWEHWCSTEGKLQWVNGAVLRHTGYTPKECMEMSDYPLSLVDAADRDRFESLFRQAVEWGRSGNDVVCRFRTKQGQLKWFSVSWLPMYDANRRCLGHRAGFRDITQRIVGQTQREQIDAQMHQIQRLESNARLAGRISHDLNNILTSVLGNAQLAQVEAQEGSVLRESLDEILNAGNRAVDLCSELRRLAGTRPTKMVRSSMQEIVSRACKSLREQMGIDLSPLARVNAELDGVQCDPNQVQFLVTHLLSNALHACHEGDLALRLCAYPTRIEADTRLTWRSPQMPVEDLCCIEVADEGEGMDDDTMRRAFDPFFTTRQGARGLGLAVCLGIIRAHDGGLWVDSNPGEGSVVRVYLPLAQAG